MTRETLKAVMAETMRTVDYGGAVYEDKAEYLLLALEAAGVRIMPVDQFEALAELVGASAFTLGALESGITVSPATVAKLKKAIDGVVTASPFSPPARDETK